MFGKTAEPTHLGPRAHIFGDDDEGSMPASQRRHGTAVEFALSVARAPNRTALLWRTDFHKLKTDILIKGPTDADYKLFARVRGANVTFVDDPNRNIAEAARRR